MIVVVEQQNTNTRLQAEYILLTRHSQARAILILRETAGIFIVWFKPFRVGDVVVVNTHFGTVEDITLRHTVIKGLENKRIIIPNSNISSDVIINSTIEDPKTQRFIEIWINYDSYLRKAMEIMEEESMKHPSMIDERTLEEKINGEPIVLVRTTGMDERGIKIRASVWAKDLSTSFDMYCDLIRDIKYRFDEEGIKMGVPHRHVSQSFNQEIVAISTQDKNDAEKQ